MSEYILTWINPTILDWSQRGWLTGVGLYWSFLNWFIVLTNLSCRENLGIKTDDDDEDDNDNNSK